LRQIIQSTALRLFIGWGLGLAWIAWLILSGPAPHPADNDEYQT